MSGNGNGHHWSKFCWQDWQKDVALRSCSLGARGFWLECLAAMHGGDPVGHLTFNGKPATLKQMAVNANCRVADAKRFHDELEEAGVFSRSENGTIFCRRMVRDAQEAEIARENGKKGGNPSLRGVNPPLNGSDNGEVKAKNLEVESEKESKSPRRSPPSGDATPPSGDPGRARADFQSHSPRETGTNLRALGTNPRAAGTNPRSNGTNPRGSAAFNAVIRERWGGAVVVDATAEEIAFGRLNHG
jgi:hypothetical protein